MSELGGNPAGWASAREKLRAAKAEPEIVTRNGKPVSVILPIAVYEELLERVEDAEDIAWLKKARKKPMHYRPLSEYLADRKARV
jgi:prevent-host-death family protein